MNHDPSRDEPLALSDLVARDGEALSGRVDGEVVALDVARGACYGLDPIGSRIWDLIAAPTAITEVCAALEAEYDVDAATCRADVLDFLSRLRIEGLIRVRRAPASAAD